MDGESATSPALLAGVRLDRLETVVAPAGRTLGLYDPGRLPDFAPLVYLHAFTILPGRAKGWGRHEHHDDRYALLVGSIEVALCDLRHDSPTCGGSVILSLHDADRQLLTIPRGVWHATRNTGVTEAIVIDAPTRPYCHAAPDKFTLPLDTDRLPITLGPEWCGY